MENNFEKQLIKVLNEEKEIPSKVRISLDTTYDRIRAISKKKNKARWKIAVAVCCVIISAAMLTNKSVRADIKSFFYFSDKGVERAVNKGFVNENSSSALNKGVKVTLDSYFVDSNKMGLSFKLKFDDSKILEEKIDRISLDYRIKNGNGDYIAEIIPDTKPLKGKSQYISSLSDKNSELDLTNNEVQYDVILESISGSIPKLENAVVEVEAVKIFYKSSENFKSIDGRWDLKLSGEKSDTANSVEYKVESNKSAIEIISAKSRPTSFNVTFAVDEKYKDVDTFDGKNMKLVDEEGKEYLSNGYSIDLKDNKIIISTNFPLSSYENVNKFKLVIASIGEVEFVK